MKEVKIFYSWQSDLPDNTNRKFIRDALHITIPHIEENNIKILLDEATRNKSGSPNIPATIIEKIKKADIFIGDITIINNSCVCNTKRTPNPNVVFELGFAVGVLGWDRIILLVNTYYTDLSRDLPFDFDRHRVSAFKTGHQDKANSKSTQNDLISLLKTSISAVICQDPTKEIDKKILSPLEIKRSRDIENIKWIMSTIHQPSLQEHFESGPRVIENCIFHFWESFNGVFTNNLFHIYDHDLFLQLKNLHASWEATVSFGEHYRSVNHSDKFIFSNPLDIPLNEGQEEAWEEIEKSLQNMNNALNQINNIIRNDYLELDVREMNKAAWVEYRTFKKDFVENTGK
jgi:hypothetical protein